jgi:hypothetical protein
MKTEKYSHEAVEAEFVKFSDNVVLPLYSKTGNNIITPDIGKEF